MDIGQFPHKVRLLFEIISELSSFTYHPSRNSLDILKNIENSIDDVGLDTLRCVWVCSHRLFFGISSNVKHTFENLSLIISQLSTIETLILPCYISLDAQVIRKLLQMLHALLLAKYALMDYEMNQFSHLWTSTNTPCSHHGYVELLLLQNNCANVNDSGIVSNGCLETLNVAVASGTFSEDGFADVRKSKYFSDPFLLQLLELIPIQVKALNDPEKAKTMIRILRESPTFKISAQYYVLNSIILAKTNEPIHTIKYYYILFDV